MRPIEASRPPFFVLSPGRSGSNAIADALAMDPSCICLHEPAPALIREATQWRYGKLSDDELISLLTRTRRWDDGVVYGETNNKLALIVPLLDRAFPDCRFVWLIRDGRDFVRSLGRRGGHTPRERETKKPWKRWRPQGDLVGAVPPDRWREMDPFERCCWHWTWVNGLIERDLGELHPNRWCRVRLEDLPGRLPDVAGFLGLNPEGMAIERANATGAGRRRTKPPKVAAWPEWDTEQRAHFDAWCGELMDECYPGWRDASGTWVEPPAVTAAG